MPPTAYPADASVIDQTTSAQVDVGRPGTSIRYVFAATSVVPLDTVETAAIRADDDLYGRVMDRLDPPAEYVLLEDPRRQLSGC